MNLLKVKNVSIIIISFFIVYILCTSVNYSQTGDSGYIQNYIVPQTSIVFKVNDSDLLHKMDFNSGDFYESFGNNTAIQKYLIKFYDITFILEYVQEFYFCLDSSGDPYSIMKLSSNENISYVLETLSNNNHKITRYSSGLIINNKDYVDTSFFISNDNIIVFGSTETALLTAKQQKHPNENILRIEKLDETLSNYKSWGILSDISNIASDSPLLLGLQKEDLDSIVFVIDYIDDAVRFTTLYRFKGGTNYNEKFIEENRLYENENDISEKYIKYRNYVDKFKLELVKLKTYSIASGKGFVVELITNTEYLPDIIITLTQLAINSLSKTEWLYDKGNIIDNIGTKVTVHELPIKDILWYDTGYIELKSENMSSHATLLKMKFTIQVNNYSQQIFEEIVNNEKEIYKTVVVVLKELNLVKLFADNINVKKSLVENLNRTVNKLIISGDIELKVISIEIKTK